MYCVNRNKMFVGFLKFYFSCKNYLGQKQTEEEYKGNAVSDFQIKNKVQKTSTLFFSQDIF